METSPIRVLHVDDDPSLLELTGEFLGREGDDLVLETATSADEGLDQIGDRPPDCIVSDYDMPGKNGIEFLRAVRETHPNLPFILFTGKGSESVASDAIAAGVTDYLQKGFDTEQYELLANRITNAVEAQQSVERLSRREKLMRATEKTAGVGGWEMDLETDELEITPGAGRITGLSPDDDLSLYGRINLYHPDDRPEVQAALSRAAKTGEEERGTWRIQPPDGSQRTVEVTITPATSDGEVTKLRGAIHDITERQERHRELEQIETLFEHTQGPLFLVAVGEEFTVKRVNFAWEEATGLAPDLSHGRTITELFGKKQASMMREKYRECVQQREPLEYEERLEFGEDPTYWETRIAPVIIDGDVEYIAGSTRNVTEKRERQRELRLLQEAIDGANVPITLADPSQEDNPLVYVNDAYKELTGYSEEEALGRNCRYLQGEETDPTKVAALREAIDDEEPVTVELRNYRKDGTEFWNRLTVTPVYDNGDLVRYLGTQEDVTERKKRERELETERRFIEQAIDTLDDVFYVVGTDGKFQRWNDSLETTTGYDSETIDKMHAADLFPEDHNKLVVDAIEETIETGEVSVEAEFQTAHGQRIPHEFTGNRLTSPDGTLLGLVGVGRDISERKKRERELRAFQQAVEATGRMVYWMDWDGAVEYANPALAAQFGSDTATMINEEKTPLTARAERDGLGEDMLSTLRDGESWEREFVTRLPDGKQLRVDQSVTPVYEGEEIRRFVAIAADATSSWRRNQQLSVLQRVLRHDLRNNLNEILLSVQIANEQPQSDTIRDHLNGIEETVNETLSLSEDIGQFRQTFENEESHSKVTDLVAVTQEQVSTVRSERQRAEFDADLSGSARVVTNDLIGQAIRNVIQNAVQHNDSETPEVAIELERRTEDEEIELKITDNGPGIPDETVAVLGSEQESQLSHLNGFGLWLVKWVVGLSGGTLEFASSDPRGTTVKLILPAVGAKDSYLENNDAH